MNEGAIAWRASNFPTGPNYAPNGEAAFRAHSGVERFEALPDVLPGEPERLWLGMLALPGIEGGRAKLLGRFMDFAEALFDLAAKVGAGRTAQERCRLLAKTQERFLVQVTQCAVRLPLVVLCATIIQRAERLSGRREYLRSQ